MIKNVVRYAIFYAGLALALLAVGIVSPTRDFPTLTSAVVGRLPASIEGAVELGLECLLLPFVLMIASAVLVFALALLMYFMARFRIFPDGIRVIAETVVEELAGVPTAEQRRLQKLAQKLKASVPPRR